MDLIGLLKARGQVPMIASPSSAGARTISNRSILASSYDRWVSIEGGYDANKFVTHRGKICCSKHGANTEEPQIDDPENLHWEIFPNPGAVATALSSSGMRWP